jgi:hypothetical protein
MRRNKIKLKLNFVVKSPVSLDQGEENILMFVTTFLFYLASAIFQVSFNFPY